MCTLAITDYLSENSNRTFNLRMIMYKSLLTALVFSIAAHAQLPVVVIPFDSEGGVTPEQVSEATRTFANKIAAKPGWKVESADRVEALIVNKPAMRQSPCVQPCAAAIAQALEVDKVIFGTLTKTTTGYSLKASLVSAESGKIFQEEVSDLGPDFRDALARVAATARLFEAPEAQEEAKADDFSQYANFLLGTAAVTVLIGALVLLL